MVSRLALCVARTHPRIDLLKGLVQDAFGEELLHHRVKKACQARVGAHILELRQLRTRQKRVRLSAAASSSLAV